MLTAGSVDGESGEQPTARPVVICGFGELGQAVANLLDSPMSGNLECGAVPYVAFDIHHERVRAARRAGFNCLYGDASRLNVSSLLQHEVLSGVKHVVCRCHVCMCKAEKSLLAALRGQVGQTRWSRFAVLVPNMQFV